MTTCRSTLLVFGLGYSGTAVARVAQAEGIAVIGTTRQPVPKAEDGIARIVFSDAADAIGRATHILATAPPDETGDPVLRLHGAAIAAAPALRWIGYLSTTGVYGDRGGGWVDERTQPAPTSERGRRRVEAERQWQAAAGTRPVDIFRLAGIYGPGRSVFEALRAGRAQRVIKPGHAFGRIHRDDIARAVIAAATQQRGTGARVLNLADDEPAESAVVIGEAARLLGVPPPQAVPFDVAQATMSPMARSFWADNRRVSSTWTKQVLGMTWLHPTFREGLRAILAEERRERPA